jgi:dolichol-phosphate mannosyltransferase
MMRNFVSVIVPTRNEVKNLQEVIDGIRPFASEIIVVDGHSTDGTQDLATSLGAKVVLDNKLGKGDALRVGAKASCGDIILFIDADQSHDPNDIPSLLRPIFDGAADHVHGSRMLGGSDELFSNFSECVRLFGSLCITLAINCRFGVRLTDSQNGFRCIKRKTFDELHLTENTTTIEQEMVIETLRRGFVLVEVPTHEFRRNFGRSSINVWKSGYRYVYCLLKNLLLPKIRPLKSDIHEIQSRYTMKLTRKPHPTAKSS